MNNAEIKEIGERPDSCKVSINAKGQWSGEIKVYAETIEEAMKICLSKSAELERIIKEKK